MARLTILGAGTPTPTPARYGTSYVLEIGGEQIMVDCGPATTHKLVKAGLWPTNIDYLFFTHHHFDHDVDYPCFLLTRWDQSIGKENVLQVFGPTLTEQLTHRILDENDGAFAHDWKARVNAPGSQTVYVNRGGTLPRTPPEVSAKDITAGKIFSGPSWEVTGADAVHVQPYLDSLAYRIDSDEGSVVFTGDTNPCDSVTKLAQGADVMVAMCWDEEEHMHELGEQHGAMGNVGAAKMAQKAEVKKLVLAHVGPNLAKHPVMEKGIGNAKKEYDGDLVFSEELMSFEV